MSPQVMLEVTGSSLIGDMLALKSVASRPPQSASSTRFRKVKPLSRLVDRIQYNLPALKWSKLLSAIVRVSSFKSGAHRTIFARELNTSGFNSYRGQTSFFHHWQHMKNKGNSSRAPNIMVRIQQQLPAGLVLLPIIVIEAQTTGGPVLVRSRRGELSSWAMAEMVLACREQTPLTIEAGEEERTMASRVRSRLVPACELPLPKRQAPLLQLLQRMPLW